ncbi:MAG: hypothetical protein FJ049_08530 [Cyanobacteria bacterium M_surface_7_m2_037]|nr:hypothetical protein [Cyanobacteria bacterium M_surface_7_m2_037]MBM5814843.1 hypothetical protein [Cyanobacteria bacterium M_DeepCast_100m_m1_067]
MSKRHTILVAMACLAAGASPSPTWAHATAGGEELAPGEFRVRPLITIEGHAGLENNLEGQPRHYALDGLFGAVFEWGLDNEGSFAIEAQLGPALVWGEAEHFYGRVHVDGHGDHHGEHHDGDHGGHHSDSHSDGSPYRRTDVKGYLQARYQPNDRVEVSLTWWPYYVTGSQGDDVAGLKNELGVQAIWALGDGDVNFALGDGLESIVDGVFLSLENRTGWESEGTYLGNYTDPWLGLGFNIDLLNITLSAGPRFYSPGSYAGLPFRTDWGGEIELEYPLANSVVVFAHWKPIYSSQGGEGWGVGWQHHIGTGISFSF